MLELLLGSRPQRHQGPETHKHKDPTTTVFMVPPSENQNVRSLCLCGLLGPYHRRAPKPIRDSEGSLGSTRVYAGRIRECKL